MTRDQRDLFSSNWRNVHLIFLLPEVGVFFSWCVVSQPMSHFHHHASWILQRDKRTHTHTHTGYCFYLVPKEIQPVHPKGNQSWIFTGRTDAEANTLATWCEELTHLKTPWRWETEGDDRGWDGWMASPTECRWVWVNSGSWWWTGRPGVLQSTGSQRVIHNRVTELNWSHVRLFVTPII